MQKIKIHNISGVRNYVVKLNGSNDQLCMLCIYGSETSLFPQDESNKISTGVLNRRQVDCCTIDTTMMLYCETCLQQNERTDVYFYFAE